MGKRENQLSFWRNLQGNRVTSSRLDCESGFALFESKMFCRDGCSEYCQYQGPEPILVMTFALNGYSQFCDQQGRVLRFSCGYTTVSIFQSGEGQRIYPANQTVHQLRLVITESLLQRYIGEQRCRTLFGVALGYQENFRQLYFQKTGFSQYLPYFKQQMIKPKDGLTQRIIALSLLSEQLKNLQSTDQPQSSLFSHERYKLVEIEQYLQNHLHQPLTNAFLCSTFAVSEYQLKHYFKKAYGISPGNFILKMRMERGRDLLAAGYRVSETAYKVGYQHPNNFTTAFNHYFGYSPKSIYSRRVI